MKIEDELKALKNAEAKLQAAQSYFAAIGMVVSTGERVIMTDKLSEASAEIQRIVAVKEYVDGKAKN